MKGRKLWFKSKDSRLTDWAVPLVSHITGIKSLNFFDLHASKTSCSFCIHAHGDYPQFQWTFGVRKELQKAKEMCTQEICLLALPVRSLSSQG